jgi:hypothetical protein
LEHRTYKNLTKMVILQYIFQSCEGYGRLLDGQPI